MLLLMVEEWVLDTKCKKSSGANRVKVKTKSAKEFYFISLSVGGMGGVGP